MKFKIIFIYFEFVGRKMCLQSETIMNMEFLNIEKACDFAKAKAWEYFESKDGVEDREWENIIGINKMEKIMTKQVDIKNYTLMVSVETL